MSNKTKHQLETERLVLEISLLENSIESKKIQIKELERTKTKKDM